MSENERFCEGAGGAVSAVGVGQADVGAEGDAGTTDAMRAVERSYQPATQDPAALLQDAPDAEGKAAGERIASLYERLRGSRRFLDGILEFCREGRTEGEVAGEVARLKGLEFCIYTADVLCSHLVEAGALERIEPAGEDVRVVEVGGVKYLDPAGNVAGQQGDGADTAAPEVAVRLKTTEAGLSALARERDLGRFQAVLAEDAGYENIYRMLLDCCANEGGATAKELGDAVDGQPEVQEPRLYASYFYEKLAECDLIVWAGKAWVITELGRRAAEYLDGAEQA